MPDLPAAADQLLPYAVIIFYAAPLHRLAFEDGEWYGSGLEMPNVMADGRTAARCVTATREALTAAVATMIEAEQRPPAAARQGTRTEQVNVRLTPEEKAVLEGAAKAAGYRGLSDFVRAGALAFRK